MNRRTFLATSAAIPFTVGEVKANVKLGIDLFSLRGQNWTPFQYLDYCAERKVKVVHFSEVRFLGGLEPANLRAVREHAAKLDIEVEIGMRSICPTSKMFEPASGTAPQQLERMIDSAVIVNSKIVRAVLGGADDRKGGAIEARIEDTVKVLKSVRSKALNANVKIAIENHAGDMQARELKTLITEAGTDFVGVCLDSGNPLWTLEDPLLTLETLHQYVLTSHLRDSAVWKTPEGASVTWVQMGRGNVGIAGYVRKFAELCPGKPLSLESIVFGPRKLAYEKAEFWDDYRNVRAWEFRRFEKLVSNGKAYRDEPWQTSDEAAREREALDESLTFTKQALGKT